MKERINWISIYPIRFLKSTLFWDHRFLILPYDDEPALSQLSQDEVFVKNSNTGNIFCIHIYTENGQLYDHWRGIALSKRLRRIAGRFVRIGYKFHRRQLRGEYVDATAYVNQKMGIYWNENPHLTEEWNLFDDCYGHVLSSYVFNLCFQTGEHFSSIVDHSLIMRN